MPDDLEESLKKATDGLEYPSESDAPFDFCRWPAKTPGTAKDQLAAHVKTGRKIEPVAVDEFFSQLDDSDDAQRFHELRKVLESRLAGLSIFRVETGEATVDIYLIGKTPQGDWAGLHTQSVET